MNIEPKLEQIEKDFYDVERRMSDPGIVSQLKELQELGKRHAQLEPVVRKYQEYRKNREEIQEAQDLLHSDDEDMRRLAEEEMAAKEPLTAGLLQELQFLLLPSDPNDERSVMMEIRAGAGGEEAALFAANLFRMYSRFSERQNWTYEIIDISETGIGGIKEIVVRIDGRLCCSCPESRRSRAAPASCPAGNSCRGRRNSAGGTRAAVLPFQDCAAVRCSATRGRHHRRDEGLAGRLREEVQVRNVATASLDRSYVAPYSSSMDREDQLL